MMIIDLLFTALIGATPILEIRGAIPVGHFALGLGIWQAAIAGAIGNIITVGILLWILPKIVVFFDKRIPILHKLIQWVFAKTRAKHSKKLALMGELFLLLFVAIPLPGSGAWTGAFLAYLFDVKYKTAFTLITAGIIIAGILISLICFGGESLMKYFFLHA